MLKTPWTERVSNKDVYNTYEKGCRYGQQSGREDSSREIHNTRIKSLIGGKIEGKPVEIHKADYVR